MPKPIADSKKSAFAEAGLPAIIEMHLEEIRELYTLDHIPWVIGYSGGKDSTAVLQLIWMAIEGLPEEQRQKPVHVISTDTLVENPIVSTWVNNSIKTMQGAAEEAGLPIQAHKLTPEVRNSFWVNLLGKGYPAPRHKFRWCTERLKIMPSNDFILNVVQASGEAILVLGTRKAESSRRAATMAKHEKGRVRDRLSPNSRLANCQVYTPIEDWIDDDVWMFLMQYKNPWGYANKDLLTMYQGATEGGECPLVVDSTTPSCGDSRFGCWVCTLVNEDKSMAAMVQNDDEKQWMLPLLKFRDRLAVKNSDGKWNDRSLRDFRRINGRLTEFNGKLVHGPYKQKIREDWLADLLRTQKWLRDNGPDYVKDVELVSLDELEEIRRIWLVEKHEIEDSLPRLYQDAIGEPYPGREQHENATLGKYELDILREVCAQRLEGEASEELYGLLRGLLDVEQRYRLMSKRKGLFAELESVLNFYLYEDEAQAQEIIERRKERSEAQETRIHELQPNEAPSLQKETEPTTAATPQQSELFDTEAEV